MTGTEARLRAAIAAAPGAAAPRLALADHFRAAGESDRADLIDVQLALARADAPLTLWAAVAETELYGGGFPDHPVTAVDDPLGRLTVGAAVRFPRRGRVTTGVVLRLAPVSGSVRRVRVGPGTGLVRLLVRPDPAPPAPAIEALHAREAVLLQYAGDRGWGSPPGVVDTWRRGMVEAVRGPGDEVAGRLDDLVAREPLAAVWFDDWPITVTDRRGMRMRAAPDHAPVWPPALAAADSIRLDTGDLLAAVCAAYWPAVSRWRFPDGTVYPAGRPR